MNTTTPSPPNGTTQEDVLGVLKDYFAVPDPLINLMICLFVATFLLNVAVSHALYKATRLKPSIRVTLFNLAVSDAIAGLVNLYHIVVANEGYAFSVECIFRYGLLIELTVVTLLFVLVLSVDRVVALVFALRYDALVTTRRLWALSALVWTLSVLFPVAGLAGVDMAFPYCVYQLFLPSYAHFLFGASCLLATLLIAALNLFTLRQSLGHIQRIAATVVVVVGGGGREGGGRGGGGEREARVAAMNHKATLTSLAVVVPFVVLCSPLQVLFFVFWAWPPLTRSLAGLVAISVCLGLVVTNSLLNPLIYVWRSAEVRKEVKRSLCLTGGVLALLWQRVRAGGRKGSRGGGGGVGRGGGGGAKRAVATVETVSENVTRDNSG